MMGLDFRRLFESAPGRYVVLAPDFTILAATDAYVAASTQSRETMIGHSFFDVFAGDSEEVKELRASLDRVLSAKAPDTAIGERRYMRRTADQTRYWNPVNKPVFDAAGELVALIHGEEDCTDVVMLRRQAEEAMQAEHQRLVESRNQLAAANEELEAFSYSIAHDLRAPLRGIQGFSQALLEDYAAVVDQRGQGYLERVSAAALRMSELIDDLLNLSRISRSPLSRGPVDLSAMARDIAAGLAQQAGRPVETVIAGGLHADADARLIRIVLENLLGNAFKFSAKTPRPRVEFGAAVHDGVTEFFVRDNGAGFDEAYAAKLFAPFQRLHAEKDFPGTGVGLATVQRIVRRHGGHAWARASVGGGATFYFTLPG